MINKNYGAKIMETETDKDGRVVCCKIEVDSRVFVVGNIYGPNNDSPDFFAEVVKIIDRLGSQESVLIGGDFNMVMDPTVDRKDSTRNHTQSHVLWCEFMERVGLNDIWRMLNPEVRRYTWHRFNRNLHTSMASRIDMIMVPQCMVDAVVNCEIEPGHWTDHSLVTLTVRLNEYRRGPGVWKFNNKLLESDKFCDNVRHIIEEIVHCTSHLDHSTWWECLKMEITAYSKSFAKKVSRRERKVLDVLRTEKFKLEKLMIDKPDKVSNNIDKLHDLEMRLEQCAREEASKSIFRSQCLYARDGEKSSSYFLSLEKKRYLEKNMKCVINNKGEVLTEQSEILKEQTKFYQDLYGTDHSVNFRLAPDEGERVLSAEESKFCDETFSKDEFYDALMTLKPNKVPGMDGITIVL